MRRTKAYLFVLATLLCVPLQSLAGQAAKVTTVDQKKTAKVAQVIQNQSKNIVYKATVTVKGKDFSFDVPMKQFEFKVVDNSCVGTMFFNGSYGNDGEFRNVLTKFYPALINKVVYEPDNARLAFSGTTGFMESASEDRMLVEVTELEKSLKSADETMSGYISFTTPQGAVQGADTVTAAMKELVSLCGGTLAAR